MYKNQSYLKSPLISTPHYKITVAATNPPPLLKSPSRNEALLLNPTATFPSYTFAPAHLMVTIGSWLRTRRSRCFMLLLCSPLLLPFFCATFPLLCIAEVFVRICRRRRSGKAEQEESKEEEAEYEERLRRCEEGEVGLLRRYLEDQLALVGSVYECGDYFNDHDHDHDCHDEDGDPDLDCKVPLLS